MLGPHLQTLVLVNTDAVSLDYLVLIRSQFKLHTNCLSTLPVQSFRSRQRLENTIFQPLSHNLAKTNFFLLFRSGVVKVQLPPIPHETSKRLSQIVNIEKIIQIYGNSQLRKMACRICFKKVFEYNVYLT